MKVTKIGLNHEKYNTPFNARKTMLRNRELMREDLMLLRCRLTHYTVGRNQGQ